jgi:hypothetical protein
MPINDRVRSTPAAAAEQSITVVDVSVTFGEEKLIWKRREQSINCVTFRSVSVALCKHEPPMNAKVLVMSGGKLISAFLSLGHAIICKQFQARTNLLSRSSPPDFFFLKKLSLALNASRNAMESHL